MTSRMYKGNFHAATYNVVPYITTDDLRKIGHNTD